MKATGASLRGRREELKISIAEVSIATKITPRMLQAIEAGDLSHLPARTFLRGFVKSYGTFLKMDVEQLLRAFNEEMMALEPKPVAPTNGPGGGEIRGDPAAAPAPAVQPTPRVNAPLIREGLSPIGKAALGLGLATLLLLVVVVFRQVQKYEREARVEEPPTTLSKIETAGESTPEPTPAPEKPATSEKPPTPAPAAAETAEVKKPEVAADPPVAKPPEVKKPEIAAAPPTEAKPAALAAKPPEARKPIAQEIIIEALDRVDVLVRVNNGEEKRISLAPDQYHTIKAAGIVAIEFSDGGAVNVIHNGRDVGVPGDLGRPKKIQFP